MRKWGQYSRFSVATSVTYHLWQYYCYLNKTLENKEKLKYTVTDIKRNTDVPYNMYNYIQVYAL